MNKPLALLAVLFAVPLNAGAAIERARAPQDEVSDILYRADGDVLSAETYTHLMMASSQATLKRMQWGFGRWGLTKYKKTVARHYDRITEKIRRYRGLAAEVSKATDPTAPFRAAAVSSKKVRKAARDIPSSVAEQVDEIHKMRSEYDADASRSALIRAEYSLVALRKRLGPSSLKESQNRVLTLARGILKDLTETRRSIRKSLPARETDKNGAHRKGRSLVLKDLEMLREDSGCLRAEIKRLEIRYHLNNYRTEGGK